MRRESIEYFRERGVTLIRPTGEAIHLRSVGAAQRYLGLSSREKVWRAIVGGYAMRGYKLMYTEDWSVRGDYRFGESNVRDSEGHLRREVLSRRRREGISRMSEETKERLSEYRRGLSGSMAKNPDSRWGKGSPKKAIHCTTNGEDYASITEAAKELGIGFQQISAAIRRNGTAHGYRFDDKEIWDEAKRVSLAIHENLKTKEI